MITSSVTVELSCDSFCFSGGILLVMIRFRAFTAAGLRSSDSRCTSDQRSR